MLDYIYDMEAEQYSFVRVPKLLLQHETYQRITPEAKLLYSLLLDRVGISLRSGWKDKQDRVYIIYPIAEIMEEMNCGKNKAVQLLDELEQKAGLIERKRQGLGKPNLIYVKSFFRTVDNSGERHFLKFENKTSGSSQIKPQEVSESNSTRIAKKKVGGKYVKYILDPKLGEMANNNGKVQYVLDFEVTPHQLRHTYITNLIAAGVDPKTVQYLAGHESSKITMDIYAKVKYNRPEEVAKALDGAFALWNEQCGS